MKAIEQYFPVALFIMLYKAALMFGSVDEILKCDHSNESYWAVLSCGTVYYAVLVVTAWLIFFSFLFFLEPGYYEDGAFGIRIENVLLVKPVELEVRMGLLSPKWFSSV